MNAAEPPEGARSFRAVLRRSGQRLCVDLPFDPRFAWGERSRYHVQGTINGVRIRGPLAALGRALVLVTPPAWLRDTPLTEGDSVEVMLFPEGPQADALPSDLAEALDADPAARDFFASLATFHRKAYLRWIDGASRRPELRKARIEELLVLLRAGKKQR